MKVLICAVWLLSSIAYGAVTEVAIEGFNFLYNDPAGTGTATSFSYQESKDSEGLRVEVEKIVKDFKVVVSGSENREFLFQNAPGFVEDATMIDLRNFNASVAERVSLGMDYGKFESPDDSLELKDLNLSCDKSQGEGESIFIEGCIKKMNLKARQFSSDGEKAENIFAKAGNSLLKATDSSSFKIKSIDFKMTNGKFDLSADIQAQISGTAKGFGNFSYDRSTKKLTIKVSEIKFGFVDVTSQVFDELKRQESETMKVKKPYIFYQLK